MNLANPTALIFSALLMLRHLGEHGAAHRTWKAMILSLAMGNHITRDRGRTSSTTEFTDEIIKQIKSFELAGGVTSAGSEKDRFSQLHSACQAVH